MQMSVDKHTMQIYHSTVSPTATVLDTVSLSLSSNMDCSIVNKNFKIFHAKLGNPIKNI